MRTLDSGLLVVILIVLTMLLILSYCLLLVKYEWCHVLFSNNTVSITTRYFYMDLTANIQSQSLNIS